MSEETLEQPNRNLNTVTIAHHAPSDQYKAHRIDSITDDLGRVTRFHYSATTGQRDLCVKVDQFDADQDDADSRRWLYAYSGRRLVTVETPPSDWSDEGTPRTATRKARTYGYTTSATGVEQLTSITDGRGVTSMRFVHDANGDVSQIDHGAGADAGTAIYTWLDSVHQADTTWAEQIDRNGNVQVIKHTKLGPSAPWETISIASVMPSGKHGSGPEHLSYETVFIHDSDAQLISVDLPGTFGIAYVRNTCGCPEQIFQFSASDVTRESARVWDLDWCGEFSVLRKVVEPRGNNAAFVAANPASGIIDEYEDIFVAQTPRTFKNIDKAKRDAYTTYLYYDHDDVAARVAAQQQAGVANWFVGATVPKSWGRTSGATLHDPPDSGAFADGDGDGHPDRGGNLVAVRGPRPFAVDPTTCALESTRQSPEQFFSWNRYGQRVFEVEPDGRWNRTEFHVSGGMNGFLKTSEVDTNWRTSDGGLDLEYGTTSGSPALSSGLALATSFEHDAFGRTTEVTNPRGHAWTTEWNLLDLVTRTTSPAPFSYERALVHDGNNNLVALAVQNVVADDDDDDGLQDDASEQVEVSAHADFVHTSAYNSANMPVRQSVDAWDSSSRTLTTALQYDPKQLLVAVRAPEGNTRWTRWDERDLPYETVLAASDGSARQRTTFDYDGDGHLVRVVDDDGDTNPSMTATYDEFGQLVSTTDELGNVASFTYDIAGHVVSSKVTGQARSRADSPTTVLQHSITSWDEAGRPFQVARELFGVNSGEGLGDLGLSRLTAAVDVSGQAAAGGTMVHALAAFDLEGKLLHTCDDNAHGSTFTYDGADRLVTATDQLGSTRTITYDACSNPIRITEVEKDATGSAAGTFRSETFFDALDRPIATVSDLGNTRRFLYDSRGNVLQVSDAMGQLTANAIELDDLPGAGEHGTFPQGAGLDLNGRGNTTRFVYDGAGRLLSTTRDLRSGGVGPGSVSSTIVTQTTYDANSRVLGRIDPRGNLTAYAYDHQDRLVREVFQDGTERRLTWSRVGTLAREVDPRGVTKSYTYDALERLQAISFAGLPPGQGQTTFVAADHDGLGRRTRHEDEDTITESWFDGLSRPVKETQTVGTGAPRANAGASLTPSVVGTVKRSYDGVGNLIRQTYPSGQVFERRHDELDRLATLKHGWGGSTFATWLHAGGGGRRLERDYTPSGGATMRQALEFDADRRVVSLESYLVSGSTRIRGFGYAWDREGHRRWERSLSGSLHDEATGAGHAFRYDSAYRLVHDDQDVADADLDAIGTNLTSVTDPPVVSAKASDYALDAAANRTSTTIAGATTAYTLQSGAPTHDAAMNQYTKIGAAVRAHDQAGNLVQTNVGGAGNATSFFDANDRLVQRLEGASDVRYRYDAAGRRVLKWDASGSFDPVVYFWDGWQTVEETDSAGTLQKQYVYGEGLDEVVRANLPDAADVDGDTNTAEKVDLFFHHNSLGSVVAVTDAAGTVKESYRYTAFGQPTIFNASGVEVGVSQVKQPYMFTGARWDEESSLYQMRLRYYDPAAGRFVSRDPLGMWGDSAQNGNGQGYCHGDPVNFVDPMGDQNFGEPVQRPGESFEDFKARGERELAPGAPPKEQRERDLRLQEERERRETWASDMKNYREGDPITAGEVAEAAAIGVVAIGAAVVVAEVAIPALAAAAMAAMESAAALAAAGLKSAAATVLAHGYRLFNLYLGLVMAWARSQPGAAAPAAGGAAGGAGGKAAATGAAAAGALVSRGCAPPTPPLGWTKEFVRGFGVFHWRITNSIFYASIGQIQGAVNGPMTFFLRMRSLARQFGVRTIRIDPTQRQSPDAAKAIQDMVNAGQLTPVVENGVTFYEHTLK